jgi:hypothetical protein
MELPKIKEKLTSELLNAFGWNAEYYLTEPKENIFDLSRFEKVLSR